MSEPKCATCKHWNVAETWDAPNKDKDSYRDDYRDPHANPNWAQCFAAQEGWKEAGKDRQWNADTKTWEPFAPIEPRRMAVWDGSEYMAELLTHRDHVCGSYAASHQALNKHQRDKPDEG